MEEFLTNVKLSWTKCKPKIGDKIPVWGTTGERYNDEFGRPIGTLIDVKPYDGVYSKYYKWIVRWTSTTPRGFTEMSIDEKWLIYRRMKNEK